MATAQIKAMQLNAVQLNAVQTRSPRLTLPILPFALGLLLIVSAHAQAPPIQQQNSADSRPSFGDAQLAIEVEGDPMTIATTARLSGAIHSIRWRDFEFIDSHDHGRQLQSAFSFDGGLQGEFWAERFNPTEAGSRRDGTGNSSSSHLLAFESTPLELRSSNQLAFWLAPGEKSFGRNAINQTVLSDYILHKRIRLGAYPDPSIIKIDLTLEGPEKSPHHYAQYEVLTGYMPPAFRKFWGVDITKQSLVPLSDGPGEQPLPVVFSTEDHQFAMGAVATGQPNWITEPIGYGRFRFEEEKVVKWNVVMRYRNSSNRNSPHFDQPKASFRVLVVLGRLEHVKSTMLGLLNDSQK